MDKRLEGLQLVCSALQIISILAQVAYFTGQHAFLGTNVVPVLVALGGFAGIVMWATWDPKKDGAWWVIKTNLVGGPILILLACFFYH